MPCVKSGARAGSLYRNLVAHALTLGASGDRAPVRQQPWVFDKLHFFKKPSRNFETFESSLYQSNVL